MAFDSATGKNVRVSKGLEGLSSTTYFKNFLVTANGKKIVAVNLDKLPVLAKKEPPKESGEAKEPGKDAAAGDGAKKPDDAKGKKDTAKPKKNDEE